MGTRDAKVTAIKAPKMSGPSGPNQSSSGPQAKPDGGEMDALLLGRLQELQVSPATLLRRTFSFQYMHFKFQSIDVKRRYVCIIV